MVLAFAHFVILYSLELRVKYYTLKMEAEEDKSSYSRNRMILFLIILSLTLFPPIISILYFNGNTNVWVIMGVPMNISSALFGIYFCLCKLYDRKHTDRFYAVTVPATSRFAKVLSIIAILLILAVFIHGVKLFLNEPIH